MKGLDFLRSMWAPKIRRKTQLIVPSVTFSNGIGSLNNQFWAFQIGYEFREALDIKFEQRVKDKKPYMVWTQGPILKFRSGDIINSKDTTRSIQIKFDNPMGWDASKEEMYQGSIIYQEFRENEGPYEKIKEHTCTQMQFLEFLIYGQHDY